MLHRKNSAKCLMRNIRPLSDSKRPMTLIKIGEVNKMLAACAWQSEWIKSSDNYSLDIGKGLHRTFERSKSLKFIHSKQLSVTWYGKNQRNIFFSFYWFLYNLDITFSPNRQPCKESCLVSLGAHQLILGELWNLYRAWIFFIKFLNKLTLRESDLEDGNILFENFIAPPPPPRESTVMSFQEKI